MHKPPGNTSVYYERMTVMARKANRTPDEDSKPEETKQLRPALTSDAREKQLINAAMQLAEKQLLEGTASSQVITHFLKLGTERERTERELLLLNKELVRAKTEALDAAKRNEEMFADAIKAMGIYAGEGDEEDYEYDDEYYD